MRSLSYMVIAALCAAAPSMAAWGQSHYSVTQLPALGGTFSSGNSIDDLGLVSGVSNLTGDAYGHAALWLNGSVHDLGTL